MKAKTKLVASMILISVASTNAFAKTIAAQSLKCGGLITLDQVNGVNILTVKKVGQSSCQTLEVDSQNIKGSLVQNTTQLKLRNDIGSQLAAIVNTEVVILNTGIAELSADQQMVNIEQQRLDMEKEKERRQKSKRNAKVAAGAVVGTAVVGAAAVNAVGSSER